MCCRVSSLDNWWSIRIPWSLFQYKEYSFQVWVCHHKIRRSWDRPIFIMGIPMLVKTKPWDGRLVTKEMKRSLVIFSAYLKDGITHLFTFIVSLQHDDGIKRKHFPRYWPFVWGIHRSPVNSPHKGQWRGVLMFSLICIWINGWVNNRDTGDLRRYRAHYDVIVMSFSTPYVLITLKRREEENETLLNKRIPDTCTTTKTLDSCIAFNFGT